MQNKKIVFISVAVLIAVFIAAVMIFQNNKTEKIEKLAENNSTGAPFVRDHSIKFGKNEKNVVITEFTDPQCPSCRAFYPAIYNIYKDNYENISLVIRYLDNHQNSKFAIKILEASRLQDRYKEVEKLIYQYQPIWADPKKPNPELLWTYLPNIEGLDIEKLKQDVATINIDKMLELDRKDAKTLGVRGTPSFFVNGKKLEKLIYQKFEDLVESEIYKEEGM
ncbi:MAG: disulfide bond formation protein DsbA [Arcobacter sp.]|nr:MAG: disulfide bond formation protein DsbA [Arcobacter sp.]